LLALALACMGLYGVITYSVNSRALEFGLRMALGSARAGVLRLVLGEAALTVGIGLALGLPLTLLAANVARPLLGGLHATSWLAVPATILTAAAVLLALTLLAALRPALRATRVDPARSLRAD
jgi:ABC-type antimicrobial peptide transport system permease subunit